MKQPSTGTGLMALGVCGLAATIVATHRSGSEALAFAPASDLPTAVAGQQSAMNQVRDSVMLPACQLPAETWLSTTPRFVQACGSVALNFGNLGMADVNHDGNLEYFAADWLDATLLSAGSTTTEFIQLPRAYLSVNGTTQTAIVLEVGPAVTNRLRELFPQAQTIRVGFAGYGQKTANGWADFDGDGDLDFALLTYIAGPSTPGYGYTWFENTGMPASQTNPYDLDRDGHVNTADLSLLLMEFTD